MGTFHYLRQGFIAKPTDYYGRQFMQASLKEIGNNLCVGNQLSIEVREAGVGEGGGRQAAGEPESQSEAFISIKMAIPYTLNIVFT